MGRIGKHPLKGFTFSLRYRFIISICTFFLSSLLASLSLCISGCNNFIRLIDLKDSLCHHSSLNRIRGLGSHQIRNICLDVRLGNRSARIVRHMSPIGPFKRPYIDSSPEFTENPTYFRRIDQFFPPGPSNAATLGSPLINESFNSKYNKETQDNY